MCGFFAFGKSSREIADLFELSNLPGSIEDIESLKFYPKSVIPTVSKNSPNQLVSQLVRRYWSLIPRWWKEDPYRVKFATFNARAEDIETKATYRSPWKEGQRCLIPVSWFYEFETVEVEGKKMPKKIPYRVEVADEEVFALAGLYEVWKDAEERAIESATIITCEAIGPLKTIHARQPVIIAREDWEKWLAKETGVGEAKSMLKPWPELKVSRIDERFNKAKGDEVTEEMVRPETAI